MIFRKQKINEEIELILNILYSIKDEDKYYFMVYGKELLRLLILQNKKK